MFEARDLGDLLRVLAATHGRRPAATGEASQASFADLDRAADDWAADLLGAGCGPGAHVGLLAANRPEWLAAAFGAWRAGARLVPISTFVSGRELAEVLDRGGVDLLIVQPRLRAHDYLALLAERALPARLREVVALGGDDAPRAALRSFSGKELRPRPMLNGGQPALPPISPDSIACILHTSGTTGRPKGVMLSHRAILATVLPTAERSGLDAGDSLLSTLPLFWVAGLVIRALPTLAAGCALHLLETFSAEAVIDALAHHRPTALHLRPPQVGQVLAHPRFDPALLSRVRKGNGRVEWFAPHLDHDRARFITGYGMTEMSGYVTALDWHEPEEIRRGGLGHALPGVEIDVVDEHGEPTARGSIGEIRVRGPGLFSGYHGEPAGAGIDERGYFATGDLGFLDDEGRLRFVGRSKDLLRVKGINVSPVEVEQVLGAHPAVEAAYVVGLPHDGIEQRLVALIVTRDGGPLPQDELQSIASSELSHYKRPERYIAIDRSDVPLGATAKPQRAALAALAESRVAGPQAGTLQGRTGGLPR